MHEAVETSDALAQRLSTVLMALFKRGNHGAMTAVAEYELTLSQLRALFVLDSSDHDLAVNEIADQVGLSMAAMGRAIDALHKSGLVSRQEDTDDRRIKRITLTPSGTAAIERIGQSRMAGILTFVDALDDGDRARLTAAVEVLDDLVQSHLPRQNCVIPPQPLATSTTASEQTA
ncbi:MAG: MarR family transcriptional regulator [Solirubrobacteraceae bacterium]|nr:MarR family transcriptional regulator [Patulibacter sp.]